jgi:hypothetical protein
MKIENFFEKILKGSSNIVIFDETPTDTQYQDALSYYSKYVESS